MPVLDIAAPGVAGAVPRAPSTKAPMAPSLEGLTSKEAENQLAKIGPNSMPDSAVHPLRLAIAKLWAPVPWMLEAAIILELILHKYAESAVIGTLLVFNAALGFFQEGKAQAPLAALKARLA